MEQIVRHKGYWCKIVEQGWKVKTWQSPETGQNETIAWRKRLYVPLDDIDNPDTHAHEVDQSGTVLEQEQAELARQRSLERSARRAQRTCRHKIKSAGLGSLLTLTYRENMESYDRMRSDFAAFLRKVRRLIPGFRAVYAFERQTRGAYHCHAAVDKLPPWFIVDGGRVRSFDLLRRYWREVVGKDNGNIDVDGHRKTRHGLPGKFRTHESLAKLAGYVSKYLTKDYHEGIAGRNRWGSTQGIEVPPAVVVELPECSLLDVIGLCFQVPEGHRLVQHRIGDFSRLYVLFTEPATG